MSYEKAARELPYLGFIFEMPIVVAGVGVRGWWGWIYCTGLYCMSHFLSQHSSLVILLSLLTKRYLKCHNLPPDGVTRRKKPPPSKILSSVSRGLTVRTLASDSGVILFGTGFGGRSLTNQPPKTPDSDKPYNSLLDAWKKPAISSGFWTSWDCVGLWLGGMRGIEHKL